MSPTTPARLPIQPKKESVDGNAVQERSSQERGQSRGNRNRKRHGCRQIRGQGIGGKTGKEGLFVRARCRQCTQCSAAILLRRFLRQSALPGGGRRALQ